MNEIVKLRAFQNQKFFQTKSVQKFFQKYPQKLPRKFSKKNLGKQFSTIFHKTLKKKVQNIDFEFSFGGASMSQ